MLTQKHIDLSKACDKHLIVIFDYHNKRRIVEAGSIKPNAHNTDLLFTGRTQDEDIVKSFHISEMENVFITNASIRRCPTCGREFHDTDDLTLSRNINVDNPADRSSA